MPTTTNVDPMSATSAGTPTSVTAPPTTKSASKETASKEAGAPQNIPAAVEFEPPLACVRRILKTTLPASTNVGKDASAAFARSAGIFIIYLTACANDFARENRRQTITANDVLAAVKELDFEEFVPKLQEFLESYRANEKRKKDAKARNKGAGTGDDEDDNNNNMLVASSGDLMDTDAKSMTVSTPQSAASAESIHSSNSMMKGMDPPQEGMPKADDESTEEEATEEEEEEDHDATRGMEDGSDMHEATPVVDHNKKRKRDDVHAAEDATE